MQQLVLHARLPGLNEYTDALKQHRQLGAAMKREWTNYVATAAKSKLKPVVRGIIVDFDYYERNQKRDPDNIIFAKKFILDGLKQGGIIPNDGWACIKGLHDSWRYVPGNEGVIITITEVDNV